MLEDGYAYEYKYDKAYKYYSDFQKAESTAQSKWLWLWDKTKCWWERWDIKEAEKKATEYKKEKAEQD